MRMLEQKYNYIFKSSTLEAKLKGRQCSFKHLLLKRKQLAEEAITDYVSDRSAHFLCIGTVQLAESTAEVRSSFVLRVLNLSYECAVVISHFGGGWDSIIREQRVMLNPDDIAEE